MDIVVPKGRYVIGVSGGVDSMALLHRLAYQPDTELIVAHFNHNIRPDSGEDAALVRQTARGYRFKYEAGSENLGSKASEVLARNARYAFLGRVKQKYNAKAIITAHHQDDLIETAFINVIRGTGRLGLTSIASNKAVLRPLLIIPKAKVVAYAQENELVWREDTTNQDTNTIRNYLRLKILLRLTELQRKELIILLEKVAKTNESLNNLIATISQIQDIENVDRAFFSSLPSKIGKELLTHHLRQTSVVDFDARTINRLAMAIKTSKPNSRHHIKQNSSLLVNLDKAQLLTP